MQWHALSKWPDVSQQLQWFANGHSQRLDLVMTTPHLGRATVRRSANKVLPWDSAGNQGEHS